MPDERSAEAEGDEPRDDGRDERREQHEQHERHEQHARRTRHVPHDHASHVWSSGRGLAAQHVALFLAPAAFFVHLQVNYLVVQWACAHGGEGWIHLVSVLALVVAAAGVWAGWRLWKSVGSEAPGEGAPPVSRVRLVAVMGGALSALFVLLLAAQWAPAFVLSPCQ